MATLQTYAEGTSGPPRKLRQIVPFVITLFFTFGSLHYLVYLTLTRSINSNLELNKYILFTFLFGLISMPIGFLSSQSRSKILGFIAWCGYIWMGFFSFLFMLSLIEVLIICFYYHDYSYWFLPVAGLLSLWSLYKGLSFPKTVTHVIKNEKLTGLTLVQISDLHVGLLHLNGKWLKKVVNAVVELKPDILAITGDLIESRLKHISEDLKALQNLSSIEHKFYITGNHEYIHGGALWETKLSQLGFHVLHNTHQMIEHKKSQIMIAGVPDRMIKRFTRKKDYSRPDLALTTNEPVDYKILLAHQPASVFDLNGATCDLILSGHTHGGQIFPFHYIVRLVQPVVAGFKVVKDTLVFAHQGTGLWGPPMRWFSQNEIVVFRWE